MNDDRIAEILSGEEAWIVGGAVRDFLLGRRVVDIDVACREPRAAANRFAKRFGGAPFPLSEKHGAWRVVAEGAEETVDFTPLPRGIDADLGTRDFTFNAIAVPVGGGDPHDPYGGQADLTAGVVRAVSDTVFVDDPLRLLRAARFEDDLGFRLDEHTEGLLRASAPLVTQPAGERTLGELLRLSPSGFRRLAELGLLEPLGGSLDGPLDALDDPDFRLVVVFRERLRSFPISRDLRRYAAALLRARRPEDESPSCDPSLSSRDGAVGARCARVRRCDRAFGGSRESSSCRSARAARARRRARSAARPRDRTYPRRHRRGARNRNDLHP